MAEHRVALLINNEQYKGVQATNSQVKEVAKLLESYGFLCTTVENLSNDKAIRSAVEAFTSRTPSCSTAFVYYHGRLAQQALLGTDGRGKYEISRLLDSLATRGGSKTQLVFLSTPDKKDIDIELPSSTLVVRSNNDLLLRGKPNADLIQRIRAASSSLQSTLSPKSTVTGQGSQAVSPSSKFAEGKQPGDEWVNEMGLVFCWCPPGTYVAGSPVELVGRFEDEEQRQVKIQHGFWLSKYELAFKQEVSRRRSSIRSIARHKLDPATMINHDDAKSMTRSYTTSERKAGRLPNDWQYSLPTEEQWEYAARAGTKTPYYFGTSLNQLPLHANFADKSYFESGDIYANSAHRTLNDGAIKLAHIGSYQPNPWGFHDMYGNVAEWCINLAIRGGSWTSVPQNCRSAYRDSFSSRNDQNFIGYRLVIQRNPPAKEKSK